MATMKKVTVKKPISKNPFAGKESAAEEKKEAGKTPPMKGKFPAFKKGGKVGKGC